MNAKKFTYYILFITWFLSSWKYLLSRALTTVELLLDKVLINLQLDQILQAELLEILHFGLVLMQIIKLITMINSPSRGGSRWSYLSTVVRSNTIFTFKETLVFLKPFFSPLIYFRDNRSELRYFAFNEYFLIIGSAYLLHLLTYNLNLNLIQ